MTDSRYYVYLHIRVADSRIFYVGKGTKYRAWAKHGRSQYWKNIALATDYDIVIVARNLFEHEALLLEKRLISLYSDTLCNLTSGGDSPVFSDATRLKMSAVRKGKPKSLDHRMKISKAHLGKVRPEITGHLNPNADNKIYTFKNSAENTYFTGTRQELCTQFNLNPLGLRQLFLKRPRTQYKGWALTEEVS